MTQYVKTTTIYPIKYILSRTIYH